MVSNKIQCWNEHLCLLGTFVKHCWKDLTKMKTSYNNNFSFIFFVPPSFPFLLPSPFFCFSPICQYVITTFHLRVKYLPLSRVWQTNRQSDFYNQTWGKHLSACAYKPFKYFISSAWRCFEAFASIKHLCLCLSLFCLKHFWKHKCIASFHCKNEINTLIMW